MEHSGRARSRQRTTVVGVADCFRMSRLAEC